VHPAEREAQRFGGGGVEPLRVVQGDEHRTILRQDTQRVEQRGRDRQRLGAVPVGWSQQECCLHGHALRSGERGQDRLDRSGEQVTEGYVRQSRLGLDRRGRQHLVA
jgi:hypothetical protein